MSRTPPSIRSALLTSLLILVGLTGGGMLLVSWFGARRTATQLADELLGPTAARVDAELDRFFEDVEAQTLVARSWAESGSLDPTDVDALNARLQPIIERHPQLSSMMVADSRGTEYLLLQDPVVPSRFTNRLVRADEWGTRVYERTFDHVEGTFEERFTELEYDPRTRVWYREALTTTEAAPIAWSDPVIFFVTKDPGITAATHVRASPAAIESGAPETTVVAFDLLLLDVARLTSTLRVLDHGVAFVLAQRAGSDELQVVGPPRDPRYEDEAVLRALLRSSDPGAEVPDSEARLPGIDAPGIAPISDAVRAWRDTGSSPIEPVRFTSGGDRWRAEFHPYAVGRNTFWIGVAVPETDLVGSMVAQQLVIAPMLLLILGIGLVRAFGLARRFSEPIEAIVRETDRLRGGDLSPPASVAPGRVLEYVRLREAQSSLREGLIARDRLVSVERDLDIARDIQRRLLPQSLPATPGYAFAGWSRPADQTGGDFYDWMTTANGRTCVTLGDATGHGIGPALIVTACRAYVRAASTDPRSTLGDALARINDLLYADIPEGRFVTAAVGVLDVAAHRMSLLSAGQAPIYFRHATDGATEAWDADGVPLGAMPGMTYEPVRTVAFEPGDTLVLLTDGFFEWANEDGEQYGLERLHRLVAERGGESPEALVDALNASVRAHVGGTPQPDDLTIVVIRRDPA